jgi:hypothetical protein
MELKSIALDTTTISVPLGDGNSDRPNLRGVESRSLILGWQRKNLKNLAIECQISIPMWVI